MSMFFFRLHNLRREEDKKRRQRETQQRAGRAPSRSLGTLGCPTMRFPNNLTLAPSRLFERTPLTPSDSLDEVALQIPRAFFPQH
ncbi:Amino-acid acetyltransferase, mitochondrial [Frankliniella fusca]|uniref:Amino-acid acetyltransferase, mitochondrial n=1 Tax=Frankliniella fusca TaxID=407009 RepID=A0AAE1I413_9NEOP|nr:Amino-acid acetyltransferase, mitochondrial [Frankliniella fusca]